MKAEKMNALRVSSCNLYGLGFPVFGVAVATRGKHAVLAVNGDTAHNSGSSVRFNLTTVNIV